MAISASGGGAIDLSGTTSIADPDSGDERYREIDVTADGAGSTIDLSALASFTDSYAGSTSAENRLSTLTAKNSGVIDAGVLTTLVGVNVTLDGTGTLPVGQFATLNNGQLTLSGDGASYAFTSLVNLDGSNVLGERRRERRFPALTSYTATLPTGLSSQIRTLSAAGAGSLLDLHNVVTITNGLNYQTARGDLGQRRRRDRLERHDVDRRPRHWATSVTARSTSRPTAPAARSICRRWPALPTIMPAAPRPRTGFPR